MISDDAFSDLKTGFLDGSLIPVATRPSIYLPPDVPWHWLVQADELRGSALPVSLMLLRMDSMAKSKGRVTKIGYDSGEVFCLGRIAVKEALDRLVAGGLISVEKRPGCKVLVKVRELKIGEGSPQKALLIGKPIPWGWVCEAAKAPTPSLIIGLAAWRYASRRNWEANIAINPLEGSTRSAKSLRRGARELQSRGLLCVLPSAPGFIRVKILNR